MNWKMLFHKAFFQIGRCIVPFLLKKYQWKTDKLPKLDEPALVMSNHLTESDMMMMISAARKHMYFVCGEHLMRSKFAKFLKTFFDPIPAPRGGNTLPAVKEILRRMGNGNSVMMFPEGCRSFDGETLPSVLATAKLIKKAGGALITYRITGGYFIAPRWGHKFRRGPAKGTVVGVYSSAELAQMTPRQIADLLDRDLYENAYERQRKDPKPYLCDAPAEGLENYLIICPKCGSYDTMETKGNAFRCTCCGLGGIHDDYGFLRGEELPFDNVLDWGRWMARRFDEDMDREAGKGLCFTERDVTFYEIHSDHSREDLAVGTELEIHEDKFVIAGREFLYKDITNQSLLYFGKSILFLHRTGYFGITGETFHAWKAARMLERSKLPAKTTS
ncbi:MAG: 1-acyl-sn-glycerol-3-phosphate acyltransferase [Oscillospiraceae bacterium]|nr:1-acyl-sn-glycerol-3-phosphate acyltransferase [Oscillospiraceae bacterium]